MTKEQTRQYVHHLGNLFRYRVPDDVMRTFERHLESADPADVAKAVDYIERRFDHFPWVSEMLNVVHDYKHHRELREDPLGAYYDEHSAIDVPPPPVQT